jgi:hypothetical protein
MYYQLFRVMEPMDIPKDIGACLELMDSLVDTIIETLKQLRNSIELREEEYQNLEKVVQKSENDIRMHIRVYQSNSFIYSSNNK